MTLMRQLSLLLTLICVALPFTASAQYELTSGNFNTVFIAPATVQTEDTSYPASPTASAGQYGSVGSASSYTSLPSAPPSGTISLVRSSLGAGFATDVARYKLGEIIPPPDYDAALQPLTVAEFWRREPVRPGEVVNGQVLIPTIQVIVTQASATSPIVTLKTEVPELAVGAYLLGQPIVIVSGITITLAGNASENIQGEVPRQVLPPERFYYSPHEGSPDRPNTPSQTVFASNSGAVTLIWVSRQPLAGGTYAVLEESFSVSSKAIGAVRSLYWSEGSFSGPQVQITDSRIADISIAYNRRVPKGVATESGVSNGIPNLTTLSFEKRNGIGYLKSYNVEGTVLIEYLQNSPAGGNSFYSLGTELVRLVRTATPYFPTVALGKEIRPHDDTGPLAAVAVGQTGLGYYSMVPRPDGSIAYFAEKETSPSKDPDDGKPANTDAYSNKVAFYWMEEGDFGIRWPKYLDLYWLRWSPNLSDYVHYTVDSNGSTPETGIAFGGGLLPDLTNQDDPEGIEAKIDVNAQRFYVTLKADKKNRALLKFSPQSGLPWYVPIYTQAEDRVLSLVTTTAAGTVVGETVHTTASTAGLEVGMVLSGPGVLGATVTVIRIISSTEFVTSGGNPSGGTYTFDVEADGKPALALTATVGTRLDPPSGFELAGEISAGTCYHPAAYLNPLTFGPAGAAAGAIIPVNAIPGKNTLKVRWFKKVTPPGGGFSPLFFPGKVGTYTVSYPLTTTPKIVIAEGVGTNDLPSPISSGTIYYQNDPTALGYNPNEEHALMLGGRAYALRDDLNVTTITDYTSAPFVLVSYTENNRPNMKAYKVVRTVDTNNDGLKDPGDILFDYPAVAGTLLVKPYPLPLLPPPTEGSGPTLASKDLEIVGEDNPTNGGFTSDTLYTGFTFEDRKGFKWVHRGPHGSTSPTLKMKLYYKLEEGFYVPGHATQPEAGTIVPFLRNDSRSGQTLVLNAIDDGQDDEPLLITYRPQWPSQTPELSVAETLTLAKFGLPQVRGQTSAQILYQQSIAKAPTGTNSEKRSVILHDSTREKFCDLPVTLTTLRSSVAIAESLGKIYFQGLPPDLQQRFYVDPLRGEKSTLILKGAFTDVPAGEDYMDLNALSAEQEKAVKALLPTGHPDKAKWDNAIDNLLLAEVETFAESSVIAGTWAPDAAKTKEVDAFGLVEVDDPNTAVDSYALTALGDGAGYVTLAFGNGGAFSPEGEPVALAVIKVVPRLYVGDLKALYSSNPFDEQVTLRHSGDYAASPGEFDFEWRWTFGDATSPAVYTTVQQRRLGEPLTNQWLVAPDPGSMLPASYPSTTVSLPFNIGVHPASYSAADKAADFPAVVLKSQSGIDFTSGVSGDIIFTAKLGVADGFVLYVNGIPALAHKAPSAFTHTAASTGLLSGPLATGALPAQFRVPSAWFSAGPNTIEVAVYSGADAGVLSELDFHLYAAAETDKVTSSPTVWRVPADGNTNMAIVGGSTSNPFGGPQFVLNDRWFTMRYKPKSADNVAGTGYSRWMPPVFVEGWIKRVLAGINPFEQRVKDLSAGVNTDISVITQAGKRWEGNIALTLNGIDDLGLIEIYETVLNRAKSMSIDANTNDPDTNNALLLAAGYLNDLYTLLGNEAYADAANPTISIDDQGSAAEVNSSRFSFESQVATSLDEELALLRGRNDFVSPGVRTAPAYNRLYWNYTRGINSGEAIYALNYNIKEKVGSSTADGIIDEADAQRSFPQGHGDAYGHYLTALTGYYRLLTNNNFTWTPRAEAVTVLGQPVTVDFQDERKFAAAANNVARSAKQVLALAWRQSYKDDPATGWSHFRDATPINTQTNVKSVQGFDEWASRSGQGALFHWVMGNALVPDVDEHHTGVQKIDRTTVLELPELAGAADSFQTMMDNANAHLNPLGLSSGAIAFDISPADHVAGVSHYEQVSGRALTALNNAAGAFNAAARMTAALRNQEISLDDFNAGIVEQERAFEGGLNEIYGVPYSGEMGPGKLYATGYGGPDLQHWYIVDRPTDLVTTSKPITITLSELKEINSFTNNPIADLAKTLTSTTTPTLNTYTVNILPNQWAQYNDTWKPGGLGTRAEHGALQDALLDADAAFLALSDARLALKKEQAALMESLTVFYEMVKLHQTTNDKMKQSHTVVLALQSVALTLATSAEVIAKASENADELGDTLAEFFPRSVGLATDATAPLRGAAKVTAGITSFVMEWGEIAANAAAGAIDIGIGAEEMSLERTLTAAGFNFEQVAAGLEFASAYRDFMTHSHEIGQLAMDYQRAVQGIRTTISAGIGLQEDLAIFRQRAAAVIQGYRTRDVAFRLFRNEALEQYRSLFDLASRYTYLAAKSYDYETGLLGTTQGQLLFDQIVASRALGDLTDGTPQLTTSTLGDGGLANAMARMNADFSVAEGRLGINNPDYNGTLFSLRTELFRIMKDDTITSDDEAWRQIVEQHMVANLLNDSDVAAQCRNIKKPNGTAVPGILIPFSTTIQHGKNFFGLELAGGDHNFTASNFATKLYSVGLALPGYVGMDIYADDALPVGTPSSNQANALAATPYVYLIPCGYDTMRAPAFGDTDQIRTWKVEDQALPLPFNLGNTAFNSVQFFNANDTLSEKPWVIRKHQAFRPVDHRVNLFYGPTPQEFTSSRLVGRSAWNTRWKIVIPAYSLLSNETDALNRFAATVQDIQLFLRTYSHSGN